MLAPSWCLIFMIHIVLGRRKANAKDGRIGQRGYFLGVVAPVLPPPKTISKSSIAPTQTIRCPLPCSSSTTRISIFTLSFQRTGRQVGERCRVSQWPRSPTRLYNTDSSRRDLATHQTLADGIHIAEIEVKKSRFVGYAIHTESWSNAKAFLDSTVKADHPKARHWCYGVSLGVDPVNERCSDDGEPAGTAGPPILQALRTEGLSDAICVVVRYFGGVKLGAGGLIRAYGEAARKVLRAAPKFERIDQTTVRVQVEPQYIGTVYEAIGRVRGTCLDEHYEDDGSLTAMLRCDTASLPVLKAALADSTKGSVIFIDERQKSLD